MISIKIRFKRTKTKDYKSKTFTFNSEKEFDDWLNEQYKDESYRKILDFKTIK